jgi:hypothetical protein
MYNISLLILQGEQRNGRSGGEFGRRIDTRKSCGARIVGCREPFYIRNDFSDPIGSDVGPNSGEQATAGGGICPSRSSDRAVDDVEREGIHVLE